MGIMGFAEIMDSSIDILRKHVKTIVFYNIGVSILAFIAIFALVFISILAMLPGAFYGSSSSIWVLVFLLVVVSLSVSLSVNVGIIRIASQYFNQEPIFAYDAIKLAVKKSPVVFGLILIIALLFVPVVAAAIALFMAITKGIELSFVGFTNPDLVKISTILFIVALILAVVLIAVGYFTIFCFALQAITIENLGVGESVKRSYRLVRGNYLRILGYNVLIFATIYIINVSLESFLGIILSVLFMVLKFMNLQQDFLLFFTATFSQVNWPLTLLSWLVITPVGTIMLTSLYFNQRFKKEGYDIVIRFNHIQKNLKG